MTNRAVVLAALATGESVLDNVLISEDTIVMIEAWRQLGLSTQLDRERLQLRITGCGGKLPRPLDMHYIDIANSGTSVRFLSAALAACGGRFQLDGVPRMRQRPIGDLLAALEDWDVHIERKNETDPNCPPFRIASTGLSGGPIRVPGNVSSQFLSGLLMAAPLAKQPAEITLAGDLVSEPYVTMTVACMREFGIDVAIDETTYRVPLGTYRPGQYSIEPDASAASYFLAAAAITGGNVTIEGLGRHSLQGDVRFASVLADMGCHVTIEPHTIHLQGGPLRGIDVDMSDISDTVQTLAAVAVFAEGKTRVSGVAHNRFKETDRIADLATELRRVGQVAVEHRDGLTIEPQPLRADTIQTYDDHRMAMSLSLLGLREPHMFVANPGCTAKTYPHYFDDLRRVFGLEMVEDR